MNSKLEPSIETIFLMASENLQLTSARFVKEVAFYNGEINNFVPSNVIKMFRNKMKGKKNELFKEILSVLLGIFIFNSAYSEEKPKIHMLLDKGLVVIETYPEKAPKTVQRIVELSNEGFAMVSHFTG